jgi:hypothetical protein
MKLLIMQFPPSCKLLVQNIDDNNNILNNKSLETFS